MTDLLLTLAGSVAGMVGAMLGLGGGIILVPMLVLLFGYDFTSAAGISLTALIGTSLSSSAGYISKGWVDFKLGTVLIMATTTGALIGGVSAGFINPRVLHILFSGALLYAAYSMVRKGRNGSSAVLHDGDHTPGGRMALGLGGALGAGWMSSVLGVGGGVITVPIMYIVLRRDINFARGTSSFMIGVTGTAGAVIYLLKGRTDINAALFASCGTMLGAYVGSILGMKIKARAVKILFALVLLYTAFSMIHKVFK